MLPNQLSSLTVFRPRTAEMTLVEIRVVERGKLLSDERWDE